MSNNLQLSEIAIAIIAKNLNPAVLNPDFLKYTGIIPTEWELATQPVYNSNLVQLVYKNGVGIIVQPNRLNVLEMIGVKQLPTEIQFATVALQLIDKLSQIEYQAVGINPKAFISFPTDEEAYKYICGQLLAPGAWQEFGGSKVNAALELSYRLKQGALNLAINQVNVQFGEQTTPAILFSGNVNYPLAGNTLPEKIQDLKRIISNWPNDVKTFQELLTEKFLPSSAVKPLSGSVF
ncbi:hypothetical protein IQ231_12265 [Cuspidothrix issatschenkoi LEGE 03284]|jgi:hypothetical protein|uniref:hypothetical protein n=1 Tax=Cuspidothrix issatschenkoi TaxID=230752 RepID=UPI00187DFAB7|nr:hypothetical protein [Cuspidothrix issatschenkoi]MBE9232430.1 hypothetical protein [Cuspidothrix issatschenkoi LEGE 03284]